MPVLADLPHAWLVEAFWQGLLLGVLLPGVTARDPDEAVCCFVVYCNNVAYSLTEVLCQRFLVCQCFVGEVFFSVMARVFIDQYPLMDLIFVGYGRMMPAFFVCFLVVSGLLFLLDVVWLELLWGEAYHVADAVSIAPDCFLDAAGMDLLGLWMWLHPSVCWLASDYPVFAIWAANQPGGNGTVMVVGVQGALIGRDPSGIVVEMGLLPELAWTLAALAQGQSLAVVANAVDPILLLVVLLRYGLIIDVTNDGERDV